MWYKSPHYKLYSGNQTKLEIEKNYKGGDGRGWDGNRIVGDGENGKIEFRGEVSVHLSSSSFNPVPSNTA